MPPSWPIPKYFLWYCPCALLLIRIASRKLQSTSQFDLKVIKDSLKFGVQISVWLIRVKIGCKFKFLHRNTGSSIYLIHGFWRLVGANDPMVNAEILPPTYSRERVIEQLAGILNCDQLQTDTLIEVTILYQENIPCWCHLFAIYKLRFLT